MEDDEFTRILPFDFTLPYAKDLAPDRPPKLHARLDSEKNSLLGIISAPPDESKSLAKRFCRKRDEDMINYF
jgi:hypothetical protein